MSKILTLHFNRYLSAKVGIFTFFFKKISTDLTKMSKVISNKKQIRRLVEIMYQNINIARGSCTKYEAEKKWKQFTIELNNLGPPTRTWKKWYRVWTDLKYKTKKKNNVNQEISESVSGQNKIYTLTDLEEIILEIMQLDVYIDPLERVFGLNEVEENKTENVFELDDEFLKSDCEQIENDNKPFENNFNENDDKFESNDSKFENDNQSESYDNQSVNDDIQPQNKDNQSEINYNQSEVNSCKDEYKFYGQMTELLGSINKHLTGIIDCKRKSYSLKKEKFDVYKKYIKSKELDRKTKLELKIKVLELENEKQNMQLKIKMLELEKQKKNMQLQSSTL